MIMIPQFARAAALGALLALPLAAPRPAHADAGCGFVLGFQAIHDLIPDVVGTCLDDEGHNPANGDGLQHTAGGLLVWRKADNWTAFTDGYRTWVNGPHGLEQRLNTQRFPWEANPEGWPVIPGGPIVGGSPPPPADGSLFAVLEGPANEGLKDDTVAIAGLDGVARAKARFTPRSVPFNENALPLLQPEARVAAGGVYYADGGGTVFVLAPDGATRPMARFPLTNGQQELSFAVSPDGVRLVAAVVTRPPIGNASGPGMPTFADGPWHVDLETAMAGGPTSTLWSRDIPTDQVMAPTGESRILNVVGWDQAGPVAVVDELLGHQNPLAGRRWVGHLAHLDPESGKPGPILGGPDCWALDELPDGTVACGDRALRGAITVRTALGAVRWTLPAAATNASRGWVALSPDGEALAVGEDANVGDPPAEQTVVYRRDGTAMRLPAGFLPEGWLDASTLIGARGDVLLDRDPLPLAVVHLDTPGRLDDLGFRGLFVGNLPRGAQ